MERETLNYKQLLLSDHGNHAKTSLYVNMHTNDCS